MPKCTQTQSEKFNFGRIGRKPIVANFDGADLGSDGGLLLLKSLDEKLALTRAAAHAVSDQRNPDLIEHPMFNPDCTARVRIVLRLRGLKRSRPAATRLNPANRARSR